MQLRRAMAVTLVACLLWAALCAPSLASGQSQKDSEKKFVGSKNSDKYHVLTCKWAERIKPENRRYFASVEEAQKAGYVPCKICKPK